MRFMCTRWLLLLLHPSPAILTPLCLRLGIMHFLLQASFLWYLLALLPFLLLFGCIPLQNLDASAFVAANFLCGVDSLGAPVEREAVTHQIEAPERRGDGLRAHVWAWIGIGNLKIEYQSQSACIFLLRERGGTGVVVMM